MEPIPFLVKVLLSSLIIVGASWLAGKNPVLAGFIIALPLMSMLSIPFSYWQYRDMGKINEFANSILVAVPVSLTFFLPFFLNKWLRMGFALTYSLAVGCLAAAPHVVRDSGLSSYPEEYSRPDQSVSAAPLGAAAYFLHYLLFKTGLFR